MPTDIEAMESRYRLAALQERADDLLVQMALLATRDTSDRLADRLDGLGEGMAIRALSLLHQRVHDATHEAEALTRDAATPPLWLAGCGHLVNTADMGPEHCDTCSPPAR